MSVLLIASGIIGSGAQSAYLLKGGGGGNSLNLLPVIYVMMPGAGAPLPKGKSS